MKIGGGFVDLGEWSTCCWMDGDDEESGDKSSPLLYCLTSVKGKAKVKIVIKVRFV